MKATREGRLRTEVSTYGFRRLIQHAVNSGAPEKVLSTVGRRWLLSKARYHGYDSVILRDLCVIAEHIAKKGHSEEQLIDLVDIALWKENLTPEYGVPLFAVEQALMARAGKLERAIHQVDSLGTADDQLLVHAEVAILTKERGENVDDHLSAIARAADSASWDIVEYVAERLAGYFPNTSISLARCIPVPESRFDIDFRELPNPGRCIYRIFAAISESDIGQARQIRQGLSTPLERLHAGLGIIELLLRKSLSEVKSYVSEVLNDVEISDAKSSIDSFVAAFIIREGAFLPLSQYVNLLDDLCEAVGMKAVVPWILAAIDYCIRKDLREVIGAVSSISQRDLRDLFYWRLQVAGADTNGLFVCEDTLLGSDLLKASKAASMAESCVEEAQHITSSIRTTIGAVHALASMAEQVVKTDWSLAQALLKMGLDLLEDDFEAVSCYLHLEALRLLVKGDGPFRNDAVAKSIANMEEVSPVSLSHEISKELGRCVASTFSDFGPEEEILSNVVDEISFDSWKEPLRGLF